MINKYFFQDFNTIPTLELATVCGNWENKIKMVLTVREFRSTKLYVHVSCKEAFICLSQKSLTGQQEERWYRWFKDLGDCGLKPALVTVKYF